MSNVVIIPSNEFKRQAKRFAKKYKSFVSDLIEFQGIIMENPSLGVDFVHKQGYKSHKYYVLFFLDKRKISKET